MTKRTVGAGIGISVLVAGLYIFTAVSGFSYNFHPLYSSCLNLSVGMTKDEVNQKMQTFLHNPDYKVVTGTAGKYGWRGRLSYDEALTFILDNEPWYKLDQHPWQCAIHFKNGTVIDIAPFFD